MGKEEFDQILRVGGFCLNWLSSILAKSEQHKDRHGSLRLRHS